MGWDRSTETIAHFLGWFHLSVETARARQDYDQFRHDRAKAADVEIKAAQNTAIKHEYDLDTYDPGLDWIPVFAALPDGAPVPSAIGGFVIDATPSQLSLPDYHIPMVQVIAEPSLTFEMPYPSSLAQVTVQVNELNDNDIFGDVSGESFVDPNTYEPILDTLVQIAEELHEVSFDLPHPDDLLETVEDLIEQIDSIEVPTDTEIVDVAVISPDQPDSIYTDGEIVEEMPELDDLLPVYFQDDETSDGEDDTETSDSDVTEETVTADDDQDIGTTIVTSTSSTGDVSEDLAETPETDKPDHEVVTGTNVLTNVSIVSSNWLDAGVIVVGEEAISLDVISQVNVLVNHTQVTPVPGDTETADGGVTAPEPDSYLTPNTVINTAGIVTVSSEDPKEEEEDTTETAEDDAEGEDTEKEDTDTPEEPIHVGGPIAYSLVTLGSDLIQFNSVDQFNFITDNDQVSLELTAKETFLGTGGNELTNTFLSQQFGIGFDLIIVGGNMITLNYIQQTNVLLDLDSVTYELPPPEQDGPTAKDDVIDAVAVDLVETVEPDEEPGPDAPAIVTQTEPVSPPPSESDVVEETVSKDVPETETGDDGPASDPVPTETDEPAGEDNVQSPGDDTAVTEPEPEDDPAPEDTEAPETPTTPTQPDAPVVLVQDDTPVVTVQEDTPVIVVPDETETVELLGDDPVTTPTGPDSGEDPTPDGTAETEPDGEEIAVSPAESDVAENPLTDPTQTTQTPPAPPDDPGPEDTGLFQVADDDGIGAPIDPAAVEELLTGDTAGTETPPTQTHVPDDPGSEVDGGIKKETGKPDTKPPKPDKPEDPVPQDETDTAPPEETITQQTPPPTPADDIIQTGSGPTISAGDNLLFNKGLIKKTGIDTGKEISDTFKDALKDMKDGEDKVSKKVLKDQAFDGVEFLRVLYIEGDFLTVNKFSQTNILGDSDQVKLKLSDMIGDMAEDVVITTGSNILANIGIIETMGVDSTVMSKDGGYSDALIHQLELTDESAVPTGVSMADLATEAVAFLAEGIIDSAMPGMEDFSPGNAPMDSAPPSDPMQAIIT